MAVANLSSAAGVYLIGRLIPASLGFLSVPIFTKILGVEGYGTFSLLMGMISLATVLSTGWLESTAVRFVGEKAARQDDHTKSFFVLLLGTILVAMAVLLGGFGLFNKLIGQDLKPFLFPAFLAFVGIAVYRPAVNYFRAIELPLHYSSSMVGYGALRLLMASSLLFFYSATPQMIFYSYFIVGIAFASFPLMTMIRKFKKSHLKRAHLKTMTKYGLPYLPLMTASWVFSMFNRFALDSIMGRESVGMYSAAYNIADQSVGFLYMAIMMAVFPRLVKVYDETSTETTSQIMKHGLSLYAIVIFPAIAGFAFLGGDLLVTLTSSEYIGASSIIPILAFNTGIIGLNQYFSKPYELAKQTVKLMKIFIAGSIIHVTIVFPLINYFGISGAAVSNSISLISISLMLILQNKNPLKVMLPLNTIWRVLIAVISMLSILLLISQFLPSGLLSILFKLLLGVVSYSLVIWFLGLHKVVLRKI